MRSIIAILEDNAERRQAMLERLQDRFPYRIEFFLTASQAMSWLEKHESEVLVMSLDHDLEPLLNHPDTEVGTGRDVANYLASHHPNFPIVIHSTNIPAAIGMQELLTESHWSVERVTPYDDLVWISREWFWAMRHLLLTTSAADLPDSTSPVVSAQTIV